MRKEPFLRSTSRARIVGTQAVNLLREGRLDHDGVEQMIGLMFYHISKAEDMYRAQVDSGLPIDFERITQ